MSNHALYFMEIVFLRTFSCFMGIHGESSIHNWFCIAVKTHTSDGYYSFKCGRGALLTFSLIDAIVVASVNRKTKTCSPMINQPQQSRKLLI